MILLLSINRLVLLLRYAPDDSLGMYKGDLAAAFMRGFRFDFKVTAFFLIPLVLLAIVDAFKPYKALPRLAKNTALFLWLLAFILIMVDQQYYAFFQSHINVLVFGLAEDDTSAVLKSAWSDHPVIRWSLIVAFSFWAIKKINELLLKRLPNTSPSFKNKVICFIIYIPFHVLLMRGSITSPFPLQRDDAFVSNHPFINYLVINPFFAVKEAIKDKQNSSSYLPESSILAKYKLENVEQGLKDLNIKSWDALYTRSPKNEILEKKPPNVVYVMMESWSGFLFDYHSPQNNLLSTFEKHSREDFLFRNMISFASSTLPSMEAMITSKEIRDVFIWNSTFRFKSFESSIAQAYKSKGYRTVFITSGKMGWRNLNHWIPKQGFDEQYGQNDILSKYDDAEDCAWGVYDEYSFRLTKDILSNEKEKPLFIFVMATSNHTPYEVPSHYKVEPTLIPEELNPALTTSEELAKKSLIGYQYANKALGDFMGSVKESSLKENTLILAVGDHSSWMLAPRNTDVMPATKAISVPLYMYIPEYLKKSIHYDPARPASHKDIVSTLVPLTLSDAKYFNLGNNLFSNSIAPNTYFGVYGDSQSFKILTSSEDDITTMNKKARAYLALNHIYFQREFCKMDSSWCK